MDFKSLSDFKLRENYFVNIGLKSSENCVKEFDSAKLSDEDKECLKKSALNLHYVLNESRLERWSSNPSKRPYEYYYWNYSKQA